ncbi:DoxX-like family protein [Jeotgalibacillus sp. ET6]|uniref:DoxX-like family protein n=1 Tax=Jeotgalibacillus sp. ET6 TaxID=3037260 RepID=UPI00241843F6|nr:DoxX-like family protein [Jeotgalibacillus sp. ET6]MDG5472913.1 DoxX-like family protein [Jeotgalibacillus sp. ET6]
MPKQKQIYVERMIQAPMEKLWKYTQQPDLHQRWDLRFSSITYLPKEHTLAKQHFTYRTNIGFGLRIEGTGVSQGEKENERGERISSLAFGSEQPISLIKEGAGYWKYTPVNTGIKFETLYQYKVRFGRAGQWFDSLIFKPMIGWATAWSFDCLAKWLENDIRPEDSVRRSLLHAALCLLMALIWIYQGLVPKLLFPETGEVALLKNSLWLSPFAEPMITLAGTIQILIGLAFLLPWKKDWLFFGAAAAMIPLGLSAIMLDPSTAIAPFNPIALNAAVAGVGLAGGLNAKNLVLARNCRRVRGEKT